MIKKNIRLIKDGVETDFANISKVYTLSKTPNSTQLWIADDDSDIDLYSDGGGVNGRVFVFRRYPVPQMDWLIDPFEVVYTDFYSTSPIGYHVKCRPSDIYDGYPIVLCDGSDPETMIGTKYEPPAAIMLTVYNGEIYKKHISGNAQLGVRVLDEENSILENTLSDYGYSRETIKEILPTDKFVKSFGLTADLTSFHNDLLDFIPVSTKNPTTAGKMRKVPLSRKEIIVKECGKDFVFTTNRLCIKTTSDEKSFWFAKEISIPDYIEIRREPTKKEYDNGQVLDYSGISVRLMKKDGTVYTDADHPDGIIPMSELVFPLNTASVRIDDYTYWNREPTLYYSSYVSFWMKSSTQDWQREFYTKNSDNVNIAYTTIQKVSNNRYYVVFAAKHGANDSVVIIKDTRYNKQTGEQIGEPSYTYHDLSSHTDHDYDFIFQGKAVNFIVSNTGIGGGFSIDWDTIDPEKLNSNEYFNRPSDTNNIKIVAFHMMYGDIVDLRVPVDYYREDGTRLRTHFTVKVGRYLEHGG